MFWFLIIGSIAGWLAGNLTRGSGFGIVGNIIMGVAGAGVGKLLFSLLGLASTGLVGSLVMSTVGAMVFLFALTKIKKIGHADDCAVVAVSSFEWILRNSTRWWIRNACQNWSFAADSFGQQKQLRPARLHALTRNRERSSYGEFRECTSGYLHRRKHFGRHENRRGE